MEKLSRMEMIDILSKTVEKCKRDIIKLDNNLDIPHQIKMEKITDLRVVLHRTQRVLLALCEQELREMKRAG